MDQRVQSLMFMIMMIIKTKIKLNYARYYVFAPARLISSIFCDFTEPKSVVCYRRFRVGFRPNLRVKMSSWTALQSLFCHPGNGNCNVWPNIGISLLFYTV